MRHRRSLSLIACWLLLALSVTALPAMAKTRAWLDRSAIAMGESVTLNIETDQMSARPDLSPLRRDFATGAQGRSQEMDMVNGHVTSRVVFTVQLAARRTGILQVPALNVGAESTDPLQLQVTAASQANGAAAMPAQSANGTELAFVQTSVSNAKPYVQESVGVTVKLYYATQLASGELDLDTPDGASLQRIGDDVSSVAAVNGRQYNVVERHFLLIPEHSGTLTLPSARFSGQAVGGFFDDFFGRSGGGVLNAHSAPVTLDVRAQPHNAPQPWLPLHDLQLRYMATPQQITAGTSADIVVEATATGATKTQFPELPTPSLPGAQVFAQPPEFKESFVDGAPRLRVVRRYSIVPGQAGKLHVDGPSLRWWDVDAGAAKTATLPDLDIEVKPGSGNFAASPPPTTSAANDTANASSVSAPAGDSSLAVAAPVPPVHPWGWIVLAVGFAVLWVLTLLVGWWLWQRRRTGSVTASPVSGPLAARHAPRHSAVDLRRALDTGGLDEVAVILCDLAGVGDLDAVIERLEDPVQRDAVIGMQRARWAADNADVPAARAALRSAFAKGPQWRPRAARKSGDLPPLYPRR